MAIRSVEPFELTGGELCLDLANTVDDRPTPVRRRDRLGTYRDVVAWSRQAGVVSARNAGRLLHESLAHPTGARRALEAVRDLRETIHRVFTAIAAGRQPSSYDLQALNVRMVEAASHRRIDARTGGFAWTWTETFPDALRQPLWAAARSAAELLTSDRRETVRECAAASCRWLFLDTSRNRSRRWCDMKVCGNREKARRFYHRKRGR